ncbi:MAG: leucine-rich repeat protein, partial [Clostridia bacterium]|nr:leucine-rich repeat protein [Clostridia bacterium]
MGEKCQNGNDTRDNGYKFAIDDVYSYSGGRERNKYSWVLEDGTLTFINPKLTWNELEFTSKYTAFANWVTEYGSEIKHIVIPTFSKFTINTDASPFKGLTNLVTVKCDATRWLMPNTCVFEDCTSLTTLGNSKNLEVGKIKLATYRIEGLQERDPNLFKGCTSVTDVDFTGFTTSYIADKDLKPVALGSKMLAGCTSLENINLTGVTALKSGSLSNCTSLEEITIPESVTAIEANAFSGCTSLKTVNIEAIAFSSGMAVKDSFPDKDGLTIYCQNKSVMDAFMAFGYEKTKVGNDQYVTGEETIDFGYAKYSYSWYLDKSSGVLTFVNPTPNVHNELYFNANTKAFTTWVADYKDYIKHIEIPYFGKFTVNTSSPFSNLKNLESVKIDAVRWVTTACGDLFDGCSSLNTLGTSESFEKGKIKFAGIRFEGLGGGKQVTRFRNCTSITSIDYTGAMAYSDTGETEQIMWI